MRLYHGSQNEFVTPKHGLGQDQHERLQALVDLRQRVSYATYHEAYEDRDSAARRKMYDLIEDPEFNRLRHSFNDLIREG